MTDEDYLPSRVTMAVEPFDPETCVLAQLKQMDDLLIAPLRDRLELGELVLLLMGQVHGYISCEKQNPFDFA